MSQERLVTILREAMALEHRGHAYYIEAALATSQPVGRKMFLTLAADELEHLTRLQSALRGALLDETPLPVEGLPGPSRGARRVVFPDAAEARREIRPDTGELSALERGMQAERDSIELYRAGADEATTDEARALFCSLVAEEEGHLVILRGEHDHLNRTGFWFDVQEFSMEVE